MMANPRNQIADVSSCARWHANPEFKSPWQMHVNDLTTTATASRQQSMTSTSNNHDVNLDSRAVSALRFPKLSHSLLLWCNHVAKVNDLPVDMLIDGKQYSFQLRPWHRSLRNHSGAGVALKIGDRESNLKLERESLAVLLLRYATVEEMTCLSSELRIAVMEAVLSPLLRTLEILCKAPVSVAQYPHQERSQEAHVMLGFTLAIEAGVSIGGVLSFNAALLPAIRSEIDRWSLPYESRWEDLRTTIYFELGTSVLPVDEVKCLKPDDVVVLEHCSYFSYQKMRLRIPPNLRLTGQLQGNTLVIENKEKFSMPPESQEETTDIDDLSVKLTFDLGEKTIAFGDLKQLQVGYTFELDGTLEELVKIRNHQQCIGVGELVQIGSRVGVRIVKFFGEKHGQST